jgi:hypothetical protein
VSGRSGTPSPEVPFESGTPDECACSTNPIVLVSRVITGAPRSIELRARLYDDDPIPLPFMTILVRSEHGDVRLKPSGGQPLILSHHSRSRGGTERHT